MNDQKMREALKNLYALVQGECPSLLENNHHDDMAREALAERPVRADDLFCPICALPQIDSPSGVTCRNGHGGVEGETFERDVAALQASLKSQMRRDSGRSCEQPAQGEAFGYFIKHSNGEGSFTTDERLAAFYRNAKVATVTAVYAAPPAPSVPDIFRILQAAKKNAETSVVEAEYSALLRKLSGRDFDLITRAMLAAVPKMPS